MPGVSPPERTGGQDADGRPAKHPFQDSYLYHQYGTRHTRNTRNSRRIALPKGGKIRGIGEKFATNLVTRTGSMTVIIATCPGRASFGTQLALTCDSGVGNGPFGFGLRVSLLAITGNDGSHREGTP